MMGQNPKTLTAANSIVLFSTDSYFSSPIQLQGFQADNAFTFGDAAMGETVMGVDGKQSGGWVAHEVQFTVFLQANAASRDQMEAFRGYCNSKMETERVTFDITIPATGKTISASGYMVSATGGTSAQKILQGTQYVFNLVVNSEDSA